MNSVLLIGHSLFTGSLRMQVRGLDVLTVEATASVLEAVSLVENVAYDVVLVQASMLTANSVVKTFGTHQSAYIAVIETEWLPEDSSKEDSRDRHEALRALQLERTSLALESGADAYLWLPLSASNELSAEKESAQLMGVAAKDAIEAALKPTTFQPSQCRLIQAHIQIGLSRAQRYRDLSRINDWLSAVALVDALTQINNRRALDLELPNLIRMAKSKSAPLSLMVLDIDYFKTVNDRYGHLVGDDILKQMAERLLENMRFYDTPFRFGGEEFVITLSNTNVVESRAIADRLREIISEKPFTLTHPVNDVSTLTITVSIGLTELRPDDDEQGRSLLDRADQNLLVAKASGRNQVVPVM